MSDKKFTQWKHYVKNYLGVSIFMFVMSMLALFTIENNYKWLMFSFFFIIYAIIIPIGSYLSYKKKYD